MRYTHLLFDLDHTLLDSHESERLAYAHTMAAIGLADPDDHFDRYVTINQAMWVAVEAGDLQPSEVRHRRFERFIAEVGVDADPHAMADAFVFGLGNFGELYEGAHGVLETLAAQHTLAMITNGLSEVQRARIERLGLADYFHTVIISSEVGVTKPRREIFDLAFAGLGNPGIENALMIGDSLTSDIAGGRNAGIDTCWYNPRRLPRSDTDIVTHEVDDLGSLEAIVTGV
ncbi:MAG: YjjG family noncanonical pyrimidine nucleotidase [Ilumatobacteraceae bacterium]|nr:YjjG family noncanonical pyrimidine nucleotidase [Ilumatobacteraceae bacterium]